MISITARDPQPIASCNFVRVLNTTIERRACEHVDRQGRLIVLLVNKEHLLVEAVAIRRSPADHSARLAVSIMRFWRLLISLNGDLQQGDTLDREIGRQEGFDGGW